MSVCTCHRARAHDSVCAGALRCESEAHGGTGGKQKRREMASTSCSLGEDKNGPLRPRPTSPRGALMLWFPREWGPPVVLAHFLPNSSHPYSHSLPSSPTPSRLHLTLHPAHCLSPPARPHPPYSSPLGHTETSLHPLVLLTAHLSSTQLPGPQLTMWAPGCGQWFRADCRPWLLSQVSVSGNKAGFSVA